MTPFTPLSTSCAASPQACHVVGCAVPTEFDTEASTEGSEAWLRDAVAAPLIEQGVAIVALTLGEGGAYVCVSGDEARLRRGAELARASAGWCGQQARLAALPVDGELNANGAGVPSARCGTAR